MALNLYCDLTTYKTRLGITSTTDDSLHETLLEAASREVDRHTRREFYVKSETRYFDGDASPLMVDDLLSITTIKLDKDSDGTFEETMTADQDYNLLTSNEFPKERIEISSRSDRDYTNFNTGVKKGVQIIGLWGYGDGESATPYRDSGDDNAAAISSTTATTFDVSSGGNFAIGQTILIDSEQMYLSGIATNTLTLNRGVNGTTAATHLINTTIYIYKYPVNVVEACLIIAADMKQLKDTGYTGVVYSPDYGERSLPKGLHPTARLYLADFVKGLYV